MKEKEIEKKKKKELWKNHVLEHNTVQMSKEWAKEIPLPFCSSACVRKYSIMHFC